MSGLFEKAKKAASDNSAKLAEGVRKAASTAKEKTGGKYDDTIDKASGAATDYLTRQDEQSQRSEGDEQGRRDRGEDGGTR